MRWHVPIVAIAFLLGSLAPASACLMREPLNRYWGDGWSMFRGAAETLKYAWYQDGLNGSIVVISTTQSITGPEKSLWSVFLPLNPELIDFSGEVIAVVDPSFPSEELKRLNIIGRSVDVDGIVPRFFSACRKGSRHAFYAIKPYSSAMEIEFRRRLPNSP